MEKEMLVIGMKPAHSKKANDFIKACDLGTEGAFIAFKEKIIVTFKDSVTKQQLKNAPVAVMMGYESIGCVQVNVTELWMIIN